METNGWIGCKAGLRSPACRAVRQFLDYLRSLYAALVSINVPNDKARAVVDAIERDMGTTIATKADLQLLRQELLAMVTKVDLAELRQEVALIRKDLEIMSERVAAVSTNITVRLGATMPGPIGLRFAALKLTGSPRWGPKVPLLRLQTV